MSGAYNCFVRRFGPDVVEDFARKHREEAQLRLAKITNGKHPQYKNGKTPKK